MPAVASVPRKLINGSSTRRTLCVKTPPRINSRAGTIHPHARDLQSDRHIDVIRPLFFFFFFCLFSYANPHRDRSRVKRDFNVTRDPKTVNTIKYREIFPLMQTLFDMLRSTL